MVARNGVANDSHRKTRRDTHSQRSVFQSSRRVVTRGTRSSEPFRAARARREHSTSYSTQPAGRAVGDARLLARRYTGLGVDTTCPAGLSRWIARYDRPTSALRHLDYKRIARFASSALRTESQRRVERVRVARLAERTTPLIVPNRPARRSATHGYEHGGIWGSASITRVPRDLAAGEPYYRHPP